MPDPEQPDPSGEEETSPAEEWRRFALVVGYLSGGGFQIAIGAWLGRTAGRWIDRKVGVTGEINFGVGLALLGFVAGVYSMFRMIKLLQRRQEAEKAGKKK